jgi:hypothetical protein
MVRSRFSSDAHGNQIRVFWFSVEPSAAGMQEQSDFRPPESLVLAV